MNLDGGGLALAVESNAERETQGERRRERVACVARFTLKRSLWCISFLAGMIWGWWDFDVFRPLRRDFCIDSAPRFLPLYDCLLHSDNEQLHFRRSEDSQPRVAKDRGRA